MLETYPGEVFHLLGFKEAPSERSLYRMVEVVGKGPPLLLERYQLILQEHGLVDREEIFQHPRDYFEGDKAGGAKLFQGQAS